MRQIKIVSDGTASGTHIYGLDGEEIKGASRLEVEVETGGLAIAHLTFCNVALEIQASSEIPLHELEDGTPA